MFLSTCEIMSTIIGALAGSIASSRVKMDLFGVIVCGTLAALGGGTVRDILLDIPVYWTLPTGEIFVLASVVTSLATFYVAQKYPPPMGTIRVADAIVLALFGMIGTEKSYLHGYTPTVSVMMGICTGVAGGLLRDVLTGNVPYVFRPGELYATAALLGGVAYAMLYYAGIDSSTCFVAGFIVTLSVRLAAIRWNWNLPSVIHLGCGAGSPGGRGKGNVFREARRAVMRSTCGSTLLCNKRKASPLTRPVHSRSACCNAGTAPAHLLRPGFPVFHEGNKGISGISLPRYGGGYPFPLIPSIRKAVFPPWKNCRTCIL